MALPPGFATVEELARRRQLHPFFVEPATPEAERQLEIAALRAELSWVLSTECPAIFARIAALLEGCLAQLQDASATSNRNEPLRGESQDGALRFALTLGPRDLQALQVQLSLTKWNRGVPWKASLAGGRRASVVLPQLLTLHNKLGQAMATIADGHATLPAAEAVLDRLLLQIPDALGSVVKPPNQGQGGVQPSTRAKLLTGQMSPEPPAPELLIDLTLWASPARLLLSAYLLRPEGAAAEEPVALETRHASVPLPALDRTFEQLERAVELCRGLRAKLQTLQEMSELVMGGDGPARSEQRSARISA